ncbi:MAG TPA: ABC transporter substrate-binding protein [Anaerolineae bacterium]
MKPRLGQSIFRFFILLIVATTIPACVVTALPGASPTIKIGVVMPVEGLDRALGYEAMFGVKLAVQERNGGQGLNGYRAEVVVLNDFNDPVEAATQARALITDPDVMGVVGHLSAAATLAALPVYQEARLAVSIPWALPTAGLNSVQDGVVNLAAPAETTSDRLEAVGRSMGFGELMKLDDDDLSRIGAEAQALELVTDATTGGEILLALDRAGIDLPRFGQVEVGSPQLVQIAQTAANGLVFVSPGPDPQQVTGAGGFIEAYQDLAGFPPGPRAVLAYDATHILLDAIEQNLASNQQRPDRSDISARIGHIRRDGLSGRIAFDAQGRRVDAPVWVYQISEGRYPGVPVSFE